MEGTRLSSPHLFLGLVSIGFSLFVDISSLCTFELNMGTREHANMLLWVDYRVISPHLSNSFDHLARFLVCALPSTSRDHARIF
jgi:hypothetical protein